MKCISLALVITFQITVFSQGAFAQNNVPRGLSNGAYAKQPYENLSKLSITGKQVYGSVALLPLVGVTLTKAGIGAAFTALSSNPIFWGVTATVGTALIIKAASNASERAYQNGRDAERRRAAVNYAVTQYHQQRAAHPNHVYNHDHELAGFYNQYLDNN